MKNHYLFHSFFFLTSPYLVTWLIFSCFQADLLLSYGYENDIKSFTPHVPRSCQCLLMSATSRCVILCYGGSATYHSCYAQMLCDIMGMLHLLFFFFFFWVVRAYFLVVLDLDNIQLQTRTMMFLALLKTICLQLTNCDLCNILLAKCFAVYDHWPLHDFILGLVLHCIMSIV